MIAAQLFLVAALSGFGCSQTFSQPSCTKIANPPPDQSGVPAICGQRGRVTNAYEGAIKQTANDAQQCQNLCLRRQVLPETGFPTGGCEYFTYNANTKVCTLNLYSKNFKPDQTSPVTLTDARCFDCSTCPPALRQNLLDIPTFEGLGRLYGPWSSAPYISTSIIHPGFQSDSALFTTCDNYREDCPDGWNLAQGFNACRGSLYKATFNYKATYDSRAKPSIGVYTGDVYVFSVPLPNNTWSSYTAYFYPYGDNANPVKTLETLNFFLYDANWENGGRFGVAFDNLAMQAVKRNTTPPASSSELVKNSGFETGKPGAWVLKTDEFSGGTVAIQRPGINSNFAVHATKDSLGSVSLSQPLPNLIEGAEYLVSFDYQATNATDFQLRLASTQSLYLTACTAEKSCNGHAQFPIIARPASTPPGDMSLVAYFGDASDSPTQTTQTLTLDNISIKRL